MLILLVTTPLAKAELIEVGILKMRFVPEHITIKQGDTVRWLNQEKRQYHSVWFESLGEPEGEYFFPEEFVERKFEDAGKFAYRCGPHPKMLGTVTVQPAPAPKIQDPNAHRKSELTYMVKQDCGSCHGMLLKGGLGPALLSKSLDVYSLEDLQAIILHGRPGTPMPPWKGILSGKDANWIAEQLKSGAFVNEK